MKQFLIFLISLNAFASTFEQDYIDPSGTPNKVILRQDAVDWIASNVLGLDLLSDKKKIGLHYIASLFYTRLMTIDEKRPAYDDLYRQMKKGDYSYSPYFVHEGLLIKILSKEEKLTDLPEYAHWRGLTVEEIFGYPGDRRLMDDVEGEATRNTCILKAHKVGSYPKGSTNVFYHEFGHFLHMSALNVMEFKVLENLYLAAKARNRFLDSYAAMSVHEYFAQGLEAYISETKTQTDRAGQFTRSGRSELLRIDPELYDFVSKLPENY